MDIPSLLTGSGAVGLGAVLLYAGRLLLDWIKQRDSAPVAKTTSAVSDAATANATLIQSLEALQAENSRMARKIKHLEDEAEIKDAKIEELEGRVNDIAHELAALKNRPKV